MRKTREEYFRRHCPNFCTENTCALSDIFQHVIVATELLGSSIYKIKEAWTGPDELQQANYALRSLPKGLKFLRAVSPLESPKAMGSTGIHDLDALHCFYGVTHCPWCRKEGQMRAQSSTTSGQYIIGWTSCARNVLAAHPPCQRPSAAMVRRTANPQGREAPVSHPCQHNHQQEVYEANLS